MYADRFGPRKVNRGSLGASVGIVGGLLAVALLSSPYIAHPPGDRAIDTYWVDPAPPPPPPDPTPPPKQAPRAKAAPRIDQPKTVVPLPAPTNVYVAPPVAGPVIDPGTLAGADAATVPYDPPKPSPPVLVGAQNDPRYARDFQPVYPAAEQRAGREGTVTLKVLIGADGRVRQVERVAAASEEFWRVTERQALAKWRFKPATRDGIPVESWRTMTVRFTLADEG